ncbi:MAG: EscU/YscU/HrcU family type III secretion system export apparatus switch protein [Candidatus Margulisbacteria bacterium]|jgi:flagellar biosynthesis protein|nr:EscU/YscU/HrcU family type III secretion system export apparatus switch protein [Candidatus Margulisiibacteriota bacterium]
MPSRREIEEKEARHRQKIKKTTLELESKPAGERSAIAIRYDVEHDAAPVILASGRGEFAEDILRIAEDHKIPFYEDKGLADLLLKLEVSTEVPPELYTLIAEVLAFIFRLDQMASKRERLYKRVKEMDDE